MMIDSGSKQDPTFVAKPNCNYPKKINFTAERYWIARIDHQRLFKYIRSRLREQIKGSQEIVRLWVKEGS